QCEIVGEPCTKTGDASFLCKVKFYRPCCDISKVCTCCWECSPRDVGGVVTNLHPKHEKRPCASRGNTLCCSDSHSACERNAWKWPLNIVTVKRTIKLRDSSRIPASVSSTALKLSEIVIRRVPRQILMPAPTLKPVCDPNIPSRSMPMPSSLGRVRSSSDIQPNVCGEGEYLDWFECRPCSEGTFMTAKMAQDRDYLTCETCYEPQMYEIIVESCTKTRDAKIKCEDGYYRRNVPGKPCQSECRRCDVCGLGINMFKNYEARACNGDQNTLCCHGHDMIAVKDECVLKKATSSPSSTAPAVTSESKNELGTVPYKTYSATHQGKGAVNDASTLYLRSKQQ
ncbi:unnamed protein product, partial [Lymnaea stagnalis]